MGTTCEPYGKEAQREVSTNLHEDIIKHEKDVAKMLLLILRWVKLKRENYVEVIVIFFSIIVLILQISLNWQFARLQQNLETSVWIVIASVGYLVILVSFVFLLRRRKRQAREMLLGLEKVAHDLKSPLISLGIFSNKNQTQAQDEEQRLNWLWVYKQIEWLKHIVQQTLDHRLLRLGRLESNYQNVRVRGTVQEVVDVLAILYSDLPERLEMQGDEFEVWSDPVKIKQIIFNLLSNAVRYTSGKIRIAWKQHDSRLRLTLSDEGPGLQKNRPFQGHGLGLEITSGLLKSCASRLVRVPVEKGTCWQFDLPLADDLARKDWKQRRWKIVFVEDDLVYAQLFLEHVKEFADVLHFSRVEKAIEYFHSPGAHCDILITDNHLKKMKGIELIPYLRKKGVPLPRAALITSQGSFDSLTTESSPGLKIFPKPLTRNEIEMMFDQLLV